MAVITFAHRGARTEHPENSLPAFRRALELGASGLETDVWLSSDGQVVCVHDGAFRSGLRRVRVGNTAAEALHALGVPRLVDVYDALGTAYELSVDLKDAAAAGPLVAAAQEHGAAERLWVCSPELESLRALAADRSGGSDAVKLVHSTHKKAVGVPLERHAHDLSELGIDAINLHHTEWTAGLVALFHRFGVKSFAWDTQEARQIRAVLAMDIDAIYCDRPDRMVAVVSEWTA